MKKFPGDIMAVDIGNSSVKVYCPDPDCEEVLECLRFPNIEEALALAPFSPLRPKVAFLSTRHLSQREREIVEQKGWWKFTAQTPVPMKVDYDRSTLGPDRLAVAVACSEDFLEEGCLIVDAGTALTLDIISRAGEFMGGNISPGLRMRFRALNEFTSRLPFVKGGKVEQRFGLDTRNAILSGVTMGMIGEIALSYRDAVSLYDIENIVFTGGDAELLAEGVALKVSELGGDIKHVVLDEGLVGKGLILAYIYNHEQNN